MRVWLKLLMWDRERLKLVTIWSQDRTCIILEHAVYTLEESKKRLTKTKTGY